MTSKTLVPHTDLVASDVGYLASFFLDASWPPGRTVVTARQGAMVRRATFVIGPPRFHGVRVPQWLGRPPLPNPVPIMVVARPSRTALVDVYASSGPAVGDRYVYATTLPVSTDARGIGEVRVAYDRADNGGYELHLRDPGATEWAHISICVACCESDVDKRGSEYCPG